MTATARVSASMASVLLTGRFMNLFYLDTYGISIGPPNLRSLENTSELAKISVLSFLEDNSPTVRNEGSAGAGSVVSGAWTQAANGSYFLRNGKVQYPYHVSQRQVEQIKIRDRAGREDTKNGIHCCGAMRIRNVTQGTLVSLTNVLNIYVQNGGSKLLGTRLGSIESVQIPPYNEQLPIFAPHKWSILTWQVHPQNLSVAVDGLELLSATSDEDNQFVVVLPSTQTGVSFGGADFLGDIDWVAWWGSEATTRLQREATIKSGTWLSPPILLSSLPEIAAAGLTRNLAFEKVEFGGFSNADHAIQLTVRMAYDIHMSDVTSTTLDLVKHTSLDTPSPRYAKDYVRGTWVQLYLSMRDGELSQLAPILNGVMLYFRAV